MIANRYLLTIESHGETISIIVELTDIDISNINKATETLNKEYSNMMWMYSPPIDDLVLIDLYTIERIDRIGQ